MFVGLEVIFEQLRVAGITSGTVLVDGSFLTEDPDPADVDLAICVSNEYYDAGSKRQQQLLRELDEDKDLKGCLFCDVHLVLRFPQGHLYWTSGENQELHFLKLFGTDRQGNEKGIAVLDLGLQ